MEVEKLGKFHADCFKCASCDTSLRGVPWKRQETKSYCAPCHAKLFAPRCVGCGEPIEGGGVLVNKTEHWHKECHAGRSKQAAPAAPKKGGGGGGSVEPAGGRRPGRARQDPMGAGRAAAAKPKTRATGGSKAKSIPGASQAVGGLIDDYANLGV